MTVMSRIVEFKNKYKNTLIGKIGKNLLNKIRYVRFYFKLIFYRISSSSYYSQMRNGSNNSDEQRKIWADTIPSSFDEKYDFRKSFIWGDWDEKFQLEIKYNVLLKKILSYSHPQTTVLELGAYDGMWTQYFLEAKKIICVDLFESDFEKIKERCKTDKIQFYCTEGNELRGIKDSSINLIFSVDSLIRASKNDISSYFKDFKRILQPGGRAVLHLPCLETPMSMHLVCTYLTLRDIKILCSAAFSKYEIHFDILPHGVIVEGVNNEVLFDKLKYI